MIDQLGSLPPIRTQLEDPTITGPDGNPQTAKEWYYFWRDSQNKINTLTELVTYGSSADRPDPVEAPDGALYVEGDRTGIIYQAQGGEWHYIAGTMYGTLSPDERPTDLGPNDAGFEFRSTDSDPNYAPRQFIWSGTEWVETTMVLYGTHAARPAPDEKTPPRTLYVETDRSEVIYQQQANAWHYLAGIMYGTLSPDQRPTGMGANDAGFQYRATDIGANSGRMFAWSGTVWVEITPNRYGTHAARLALTTANVWNGTVYVETDRGEVSYQLQGSTWFFLAGTMFGTLSPDQRPTDLGANDRGFAYRGTDQPKQYIWSGSAWIDQTSSVQFAQCSATIALTSTTQLIPGAALTLPRAGTYLILAVFDFLVGSVTSGTTYCIGNISAPGFSGNQDAIFAGVTTATSATARATVSQFYVYQTASTGQVVQLQAFISGTASVSVQNNHTTITALWVSP